MSSVPNYSIAINGNSNDSDLVLGSVSGSITEYAGSIDLVPLTGKVNTLETSMNSVETTLLATNDFLRLNAATSNSILGYVTYKDSVSDASLNYYYENLGTVGVKPEIEEKGVLAFKTLKQVNTRTVAYYETWSNIKTKNDHTWADSFPNQELIVGNPNSHPNFSAAFPYIFNSDVIGEPVEIELNDTSVYSRVLQINSTNPTNPTDVSNLMTLRSSALDSSGCENFMVFETLGVSNEHIIIEQWKNKSSFNNWKNSNTSNNILNIVRNDNITILGDFPACGFLPTNNDESLNNEILKNKFYDDNDKVSYLNQLLTYQQREKILNKEFAHYRIGFQKYSNGINADRIEAQEVFLQGLKTKIKSDYDIDIDAYMNYPVDENGNQILTGEVIVAFVLGFPSFDMHNKVVAIESNMDLSSTATLAYQFTNYGSASSLSVDTWMFISDLDKETIIDSLSENWIDDGPLKSLMPNGNYFDNLPFTDHKSNSWWDLVTNIAVFNNRYNIKFSNFSNLRINIGDNVNLETTMNLVENNVNTLETSMARKEFVWVSIVIKHDHSAGVYYDTPTTPLNDESIATLEAIKAHVLASVPGSDFNYIYDLSNQVRYEIYNIIDPSMQHDVLEAFFEAASVGNTSSVIREVKYTTMNPKVFGTYSTYKSYTESTDSIPTLSNLSSVAQTFINTAFSWVTGSPPNGMGASSVQEWWDTVFTYKNFTEQAALGTTGQVINYDNLETNVTTIDDTLISNYLGSKMFGPSTMDFAIKLSNDGKKMMWYRPLTGATKPSSKFGAASFFNDLSNAWKEAEYDFDSIVYKPAENMIVLTVNEISFNPVTPTGETSPGFTRISYKMAYDLNSDQLIGYLSDFKFKYTTAQWNDLSNQQGIYAALAFYIPGYITQVQFDAYVTLGNTVESNGLKHYQNNLMSDIYYYVSVNYPEVNNSEGIGGFYSRYSMNEVEQHLDTRTTTLETNVNTLETSMNSLETLSDYKLSAGKGDIIYVADGITWNSGKVANYVVAKLINELYPTKSVVASNYEIGGYTNGQGTNIHSQIGTGNANTPAFDAEFWGEAGFGYAVSDITNGITQNMYSVPNSAAQNDGFYVPDWVLDSGLPGTADLSNIIRAPGFVSNWGTTPPTGLVAAINAVIASNSGFANYYAAPTWWGHTFESQADFDALGINVTVVYPADGADYGFTNYLANLQTRGTQPTTISGDNLFWGFTWLPLWIGSEGTTFIYSNFPSTTVKKLKGPIFETLFPAATAMYDAVDFTSADIAEFSYDTDISGLSVVAAGDKWLLDNSGATTDRVNTWLAATVTTTPASKFTPSTWLAATDIVTRNRTTTLETNVTTLETSMNSVERRVTSLEPSFDILETPFGGWKLTVFSHNDAESKYFFAKTPVDQNDNLRVPYGTMSRVASVQNKVRSHYESRGDYTLTIGTGDNIQPTALNNDTKKLDLPVTINGITYSQSVDSRNFPYDTLASASIGYDIYTLGNHELGFLGHRDIDQSSYDGFTYMCDSLSGSVHFLSANWQFNKAPLNSIVKKSAVVSKTIGNTTHNIGIIGLNNPSLGNLGVNTSSSDVSLTSLVSMVGLDQSYNELAALIDTEYDSCVAAGADIVLVTGHMYLSEFQTILPLTSKPITAFFSGGNEDYYSKNNISIKGDTPSFNLSPDITNSAGYTIKIPRENKGQYGYFGASTFAFDSLNTLVGFTQDTIPVMHSSLYTPSFPPNSSMKSANKTINAIIANSKSDGELWEESDFVMRTGDTPLYEIQNLLNKLSFNYDLPGLGTLYFETPSNETIYLNASLKHEKPLCRSQWTNLTILDNDVVLNNLNIQTGDDAATRRSKITALGYSLIDNSFGDGLDLVGAVPIAMSSGASLRGSIDIGRVPQLIASLAKGYGNSWAVKLIQYDELKAILEISTDTLPGSASGNFMHFSAGMNSDTTKIPVDISVNISNSPGNRVTINRIGDLSGVDISSATYLLFGPGFQLSNGFDKMPDHGTDVSFENFDISYQYNSGNYNVSMTNYGPPNGYANSWDDFMKWLATRSLNNPSTTVPTDYITEIIPGLNY